MDINVVFAIVLCVVAISGIASVMFSRKGWTDNNVRFVGLVIVAFLGVFVYLIADPESKEILPAVFGLLGGIAGALGSKNASSDAKPPAE